MDCSNRNSRVEFINDIAQLNQSSSWREKGVKASDLSKLVANNLDYIYLSLGNNAHCEELTTFAERIKQEFGENKKAAKVADQIDALLAKPASSEIMDKEIIGDKNMAGEVFSHLQGVPELSQLAGVSKSWNKAMRKESELNFSHSTDPETVVTRLQTVGQNVRTLNLNGVPLTNEMLEAIAIACPHLQKIYLNHTGIGNASLSHLGHHNPFLKEIHLQNNIKIDGENGALAELVNCRHLEILDLNSTNVTANAAMAFAKKLPEGAPLKRIDLSYTKVDDNTLGVLGQKCTHLQRIDLAQTRVGDLGVAKLMKECHSTLKFIGVRASAVSTSMMDRLQRSNVLSDV